MPLTITPERPDTPDSITLITELEAHLDPLYPKKSRHGYSVEKLIAQGVAFFVARVDGAAYRLGSASPGAPAGCGGIQLFGSEFGELKRMFVRPAFRGLGIGKRMIEHLAEHARARGVTTLRLETGIHQKEAIGLYEGAGFRQIGPFADYREDPLSRFYEMRIG